jgi:hypothetical protein
MEDGMDYHSDDVEEIRFEFLRSGRSPKVSLGIGPRDIKRLTYVFSSLDGKGKGECRIHRTSKDMEAIKAWYLRLPCEVNYEGENLPFAARKVLRALLRTPRGQLSHAEKTTLWTSQGQRCNQCREEVALEDADCDHVLSLDEGGTNSLDNFQLLCTLVMPPGKE